jgi:hypothetical protein
MRNAIFCVGSRTWNEGSKAVELLRQALGFRYAAWRSRASVDARLEP